MYWTILCYHPYLVSLLFADLLSLHLVTFYCFFNPVCHFYILDLKFAHNQSSKSVPQAFSADVCRRLKNLWPGSVQTLSQQWTRMTIPVSIHINHNSNSAILSNNFVLLLVICAHAYKWRKWHHKWSHIILQWLVRRLQSSEKAMAGALLSVKCCCFVGKLPWKSHAILN